MKLTRREVLRLGLGAGAAVALGWRPGRAGGVPLRPAGARGAPLRPAPDLIMKPIPSSGEEIPVIGIGTARRYDVGTSAEERTPLKETLRIFSDAGGTVIDTAPSYGDAETVIGDLVEELGIRDRLFLATKVRAEGKAAGEAEIASSFERLRTDHFELLQVHNLRDVDTQLATLRAMKGAGTIRYIGITTSSFRQYEPFEQVMQREDLDFIQVNYSLDSRDAAERILPLAEDRGMAVLVNLPFGRGRLFETVGERPLPDWAAEFDATTWAQFFLKFVVGHPAVTCAIPGTAKPEYAQDNIMAAVGRLPDASTRRRMIELYDSLG